MSGLDKYYLKDNPFDIFSQEHAMADRQKEWSQIKSSLEAAFAGRSPRYFVILGDYGVGKTYMLEQVYKWVSDGQTKSKVLAVNAKNVLSERRMALMESEPRWSKFGLDFVVRIFDNMEPERLTGLMAKAKLAESTSKFKGLFEGVRDQNNHALAYLKGEKIPIKEAQALGLTATSIVDSVTGLAIFFDFLTVTYSAGYTSFLLLVDEFEYIATQGEKKITQILNTFRKIIDDFGSYDARLSGQIARPLFMFATSPGGWDYLKNLETVSMKKTGGAGIAPFMERISPSDMIRLQPFSLEHTMELVQARLAEVRTPGKIPSSIFPFSEEAIKYVNEVSFNKPRNALQYCGILLEDAIREDLKEIDAANTQKILQKYGIYLPSADKSKKS